MNSHCETGALLFALLQQIEHRWTGAGGWPSTATRCENLVHSFVQHLMPPGKEPCNALSHFDTDCGLSDSLGGVAALAHKGL